MSKTLPTERLASVLIESGNYVQALTSLRTVVAQVLRDWAIMPQEAIMAELREALDQANTVQPSAIPEAIAYLKANERRLGAARNAQRKRRGLSPRDFNPDLPAEAAPDFPQESFPTLDLADIEAKLKALATTEE